MNERVNSKEYWEKRFADRDWDKNKGREQTAFFFNLLLKMLPQWILTDIQVNKMTIADLGCAEGQGTALLASRFGTNVCGLDVSESAIKTASKLFPDLSFSVFNIHKNTKNYDVCILSNVLEHFVMPFEVAKYVASYTKNYLICLLPFEETPLMAEHTVSFNYSNIPLAIGEFSLVHFAQTDCRKIPNTLFEAKQILLIYARKSAVKESISIHSMSGMIELFHHSIEKYEHELIELCNTPGFAVDDNAAQNEMTLDIHTKLAVVKKIIYAGNDANSLDSQMCIRIFKVIQEIESCYEALVRKVTMTTASNEESLLKYNTVASKFQNLQLMQCEFQQIRHFNEELQESNQRLQEHNQKLQVNFSHTDAALAAVQQKFTDLLVRFNALNDAYGEVVTAYQAIQNCRTWRTANKLKNIARSTGMLQFAKYLLAVRKFGLVAGTKMAFVKVFHKQKFVQNSILPAQLNAAYENEEQAEAAIIFRRDIYQKILEGCNFVDEILQLNQFLAEKTYKGIVIYPHAVHWEPMQRPQHILREFAYRGYLCFFCDCENEKKLCQEVEPNLIVVNNEGLLLPFLQDKNPIVLITYFLQSAFCEFLPQKTVWFDVLDRLDFFALSGNISTQVYCCLLKSAQVVSYSSNELKQFVETRSDAILLPNAVNLSDFVQKDVLYEIDRNYLPIISKEKPVIGYYGAIEEWFDYQAVVYLADHFNCEIVVIGHMGIAENLLHRPNIHLMGEKTYWELQKYSRSFHMALIPFVVNHLTNAVSPVKFFEYCALGIPTISSEILEMLQFKGDAVSFYQDGPSLVLCCQNMWNNIQDTSIQKAALEIAQKNNWSIRTDAVATRLCSSLDTMQFMAEANQTKAVAVEAVTFFKYNGTCYYSGGAERYLIDLHEVCKEMGITLRVYQYGDSRWLRLYGDLEVIGMHDPSIDPCITTTAVIEGMSRLFDSITRYQVKLSIYSPFFISTKTPGSKSIGISHGIAWDSEFNKHDGVSFWNANISKIEAARYCDKMVSVDTNTANWFQTIDYQLGKKIKYIPNYVDNTEFSPRDDFDVLREKVMITYPRRLYGARGLYVVLDVLDEILSKYPNVAFHFVGKGFEEDTKHVEKKVAKWSGRVKWYSCPPNAMHEVYKMSDISLIPTMYSEGTSLSCLEALSSGNAVIATRVGGLTDLVLNCYNGLLIEPNKEALKDALCFLLDNPEQMLAYKRRGIETAKAFSKVRWKEMWKKEITSSLGTTLSPARTAVIKSCYIKCETIQLNNKKLLAVVKTLLEDKWFVFIASKHRAASHERLQFLTLEEEIYFDPTLTLNDVDGTLENYQFQK